MIKRTRREHIFEMIESNRDWNVLDLGCGRDGIRFAATYADLENYASDYPNHKFVQTEASKTPFKDKEFDFVFSLHIAEHVLDPREFCEELVRISKRGLIEVPTPFFDNLVIGNSNPPPHGHVWWVTFDDIKNEIVFKPRLIITDDMALPSDTTFLMPFFRDSIVTELYWEDSIELRQEDSYYSYTAGNSDAPRVIDLRGRKVPDNLRKWRPR
jgi:SAM-dependent methyltransferase